jgi:ABC-2 type transport system ATP-binding protein
MQKKPVVNRLFCGQTNSLMNPVLKIQNLNKTFAGYSALSAIDLRVSANTIHGLVGLNGAGKTTLLKCILDLHRADSGEIRIHDMPSTVTQARDKLIYLPERVATPDYMNGWVYLQFIIDAHVPAQQRKAAHARIESLCAKLDFAVAALDKPLQALSKGMTQKLALIGCLLSDKQFLILDEPMSGLDPKVRVLFRNVIGELRRDGKTILMCSHLMLDIENLCDQVSILHAGRMLFSGKAADCREQYGTKDFESAFLKCIESH